MPVLMIVGWDLIAWVQAVRQHGALVRRQLARYGLSGVPVQWWLEEARA